MRHEQIERIHDGVGFIAALDQSGGSTPKALRLYGVEDGRYSDEKEMYRLIHQMRTRIITSPVFTSKRILAVIIFEETMKSSVEEYGTAEYLWKVKGIPTFLKVDNGLKEIESGVQLMKNIPELPQRLDSALAHNVIGTKMRSVIKLANKAGIDQLLDQQFEFAKVILRKGLLPIVEPEVDISSPEKADAEEFLLSGLRERIRSLASDEKIVLKLSLPEKVNLYREFTAEPKVVRVAALSGGYSQKVAVEKLKLNEGMIASFSRALTEGLSEDSSEDEFNELLDASVEKIFEASVK